MTIRALFLLLLISGALNACQAQPSTSEIWIAVSPRITLPPDVPVLTEEVGNFYGTALEILRSQHLREKVLASDSTRFPRAIAAKLQLHVEQLPGTSIIRLTATGAEPPLCDSFLDALVREFFHFTTQQKSAQYAAALSRTTSAIEAAADDPALQESLTAFRRGLRFAAAIDTQPLWHVYPRHK